MKNLENYGVLEMTNSEVNSIDGGIIPLALVVAFYLLHPLAIHKAY